MNRRVACKRPLCCSRDAMDASQSWCRSCVAVLRLTVRPPARAMTHDPCNAKFAETLAFTYWLLRDEKVDGRRDGVRCFGEEVNQRTKRLT